MRSAAGKEKPGRRKTGQRQKDISTVEGTVHTNHLSVAWNLTWEMQGKREFARIMA
jgi:hypothetical protein